MAQDLIPIESLCNKLANDYTKGKRSMRRKSTDVEGFLDVLEDGSVDELTGNMIGAKERKSSKKSKSIKSLKEVDGESSSSDVNDMNMNVEESKVESNIPKGIMKPWNAEKVIKKSDKSVKMNLTKSMTKIDGGNNSSLIHSAFKNTKKNMKNISKSMRDGDFESIENSPVKREDPNRHPINTIQLIDDYLEIGNPSYFRNTTYKEFKNNLRDT